MNKIKIYTSSLKGTVGGIEYAWFGGFGSVIKSREKNIPLGTVRMIGNIIFYATSYEHNSKWFRRRTINWVPQDEISSEWIEEFRRAFFQ